MKVICITKPLHNIARESKGRYARSIPTPVVGNEYTVASKLEVDNTLYYELAEFPPEGNEYFYYWCNWFARLSDIDENERSMIGKVPQDVIEGHMEYVRNLVEKVKPDL